MRRVISAILVVVIMTIGQSGDLLLLENSSKSQSSSSLLLDFANGPENGDNVTGLLTITISTSGIGNASSMLIEISSNGIDWSEVVNLTTGPWLTYLDTTSYSNGTYTLRVKAWDSDVSEFTNWHVSGEFNIVNQVPIITSFQLTNSGVGTGINALN